MSRNRLIHYGMLILAAAVLIWFGAWLSKRVEWILPYTGAVGGILIVLGVAMELRNRRLASVLAISEKLSRQTLP